MPALQPGDLARASTRPMPQQPLLSVRDLTVVFDLPGGVATALDQVSFEIAAGQTLGLVGESGSGKSVTALSLMRLLRAPGRIAGGHVHFEGRDLLTIPEDDMRGVRGRSIGFVFQEPMTALDPVYTVGDQIIEALTVHGVAGGDAARARALELLDAVRIPNAASRLRDYPHQLSGGMRQRVCIAIAIACRPALLIADEPTTALDVTIQAELLDLLREMRDTLGLAMLLITHDLGVIAGHADTVAVMYAGRIVEQGLVREVLRRPQHPYTRGLLGSLPGTTRGAALTPIPGSVPQLGAFPKGCAFHPRCPESFAPCSQAIPGVFHVSESHGVRCFLHEHHGSR
ncbi:MAG: ABC transporter ATP-binding protein [Vicinamibacterales bacterium]